MANSGSDTSPVLARLPTYKSTATVMADERAHTVHRQTPYVAIGSFFIACISIMACILILKTSDDQIVDSWPTAAAPVQPAVMLSIGAALVNMSIHFMLFEGVVITWWKKAIRGTTVGDLERIYSHGSNLPAALRALFTRNFNFVALASIMVSMVALDGPLLQKASHVKLQPWVDSTAIQINIAHNATMKDHPTGYSVGRTPNIGLLSTEFLTVAQQYSTRAAINVTSAGCQGTCVMDILLPGLDVNCSTTTTPLSITMTPGKSTDILSYAFSFNGKFDPSLMTLNTTSRLTETSSHLTTQICTLHYARVSYPIQVQNGSVTLLARTKQNETNGLLDLPLETTGMGTFPSILGGVALLAQRKFGATASLYMNGAPYELDSEGESALSYLDMSSGTSDTTDYTFLDPTSDILSSLREIMFRYSIAISNDSTAQSLPAIDSHTHQVYNSDYRYLAAAVALMLAAVLASSANLWGWWELHREFTLGPFEVAKAFNAPYLEDVTFWGCKDGGFRGIKSRPIRYGEIVEVEMEENLRRNDRGSDDNKDITRLKTVPLKLTAVRDLGESEGGTSRRKAWTNDVQGDSGNRKNGRWVKLGMGIPSTYR